MFFLAPFLDEVTCEKLPSNAFIQIKRNMFLEWSRFDQSCLPRVEVSESFLEPAKVSVYISKPIFYPFLSTFNEWTIDNDAPLT